MKNKTITKHAQALAALSRLLVYPESDFSEALDRAISLLLACYPSQAPILVQFKEVVEKLSPERLEEIYTRTFDLAPVCVPYISTYIYGDENFERGALMSRLAERYTEEGLELNGELPDHLAVVFGFAPRFEEEELLELMRFCLKDAVGKMKDALKEAENPYALVLELAGKLIESELEGTEP